MNMLGCCVQCFDILRYLASSCLDQCLSFHIKSSKGTEMLWTTCLPLYSHMVLCDSNPSRVEPCRAVNACSTEEFSSWFVLPGPPGCPFVSDRLKQVRSDPGRRVSLDVFSVLQQPIARCRALCITGNVVNVAEAKERADFESETRSAGMPRILYTRGPRLVGCCALNSSISVSFSSLKVRVLQQLKSLPRLQTRSLNRDRGKSRPKNHVATHLCHNSKAVDRVDYILNVWKPNGRK